MLEGAQFLSLMRDLDQIAFERELLVTQAMEWHQRLSHLDYEELKKVSRGDAGKERIRGMPDLRDLKVKYVQGCEECGWGMEERRVVL